MLTLEQQIRSEVDCLKSNQGVVARRLSEEAASLDSRSRQGKSISLQIQTVAKLATELREIEVQLAALEGLK